MEINFGEIKLAVQRRDQFLLEHPELMPLQEEINLVLLKAGKNKYARNQAIQSLLLNTWFKIINAC